MRSHSSSFSYGVLAFEAVDTPSESRAGVSDSWRAASSRRWEIRYELRSGWEEVLEKDLMIACKSSIRCEALIIVSGASSLSAVLFEGRFL